MPTDCTRFVVEYLPVLLDGSAHNLHVSMSLH